VHPTPTPRRIGLALAFALFALTSSRATAQDVAELLRRAEAALSAGKPKEAIDAWRAA
jgi:hypothetical protein